VTTRIHHLLDRWLTESPDQPFIHLPDGRSLTFADLGALTATAEAELLALDVLPGDRVLVVAETAPSTPR
jgi:acyl-CoA synthetase (AMP-forming)/AMP-acid ligase II